MLHPIRSCYFDYKRDKYPHFDVGELDECLQKSCRLLSARGVNYHFLDETLLERHGFVEGKKIGCGQCAYDYLVLPKMLTMGENTRKLLEQYARNGGKILLLDGKPSYVAGVPYDYTWLETNCTLEEILQDQPFRVTNADTELYYAYRKIHGKQFLFVQNGSGDKTYTQTFDFGPEIHSFTELDPVTLETKRCSLTVTLPENGSLLLFPSDELVSCVPQRPRIDLKMTDAQVEFDTNFLTVDTVRYSKNGKDFSPPILRSKLFEQLLSERYEGDLWLQYEFDVQVLPEKLTLLAEKANTANAVLNGNAIFFHAQYEKEPALWMADITSCLRLGKNIYQTQMQWHQSEKTYHTLFGENVTVSLKTCIVYESEIESIYLAGKFGVYSAEPFEQAEDGTLIGHSFRIGPVPVRVQEPTTEGLPFFRGELTMRKKVFLEDDKVILRVLGRYTTARVKINGREAGELVLSRQLDVTGIAKPGENLVEITFVVGNRNLLGPFHYVENDIYIGPDTFDSYGLEDADNGQPKYKLEKFFPER